MCIYIQILAVITLGTHVYVCNNIFTVSALEEADGS